MSQFLQDNWLALYTIWGLISAIIGMLATPQAKKAEWILIFFFCVTLPFVFWAITIIAIIIRLFKEKK